jgi:SAM-dependent methyltransferase
MARAVAGLAAEARPLKRLAGAGHGIDHVRFAYSPSIDPARWSEALIGAGFTVDSSFVIGASNATSIQPYVSGAYQPQSFDRRIMTGLWSDKAGIICPLIAVGDGKPALAESWQWRLGSNDDNLAPLLDFRRMEAFFIVSESTPVLNQYYHDYRVYNWPPPELSPRVNLLDCGSMNNPERIAATLDEVSFLQKEFGRFWRLVSHREFLDAAIVEAQRRVPGSTVTVLEKQLRAHEYLETIPQGSPLRQDVADFVDFLPSNLGSVLELGSGNGQLAAALRPRADSYVCTDIGRSFATSVQDIADCVMTNIHQLPFVARCFRTVVANNVLEHLYDPLSCLKEVARVLKPEGRLYALVPLDGLNPSHQLKSHLWKADEENIRVALQYAGLTPLRLETINLYRLGVIGAFPSCNGLVCKVEAARIP